MNFSGLVVVVVVALLVVATDAQHPADQVRWKANYF
jgi:hypothetical protein